MLSKLSIILFTILLVVSVTSGFYINHLEKQLKTQGTTSVTTVTVVEHDTIKVVSDPIKITKYVDRPIYITKSDSTYIDSIYTMKKELALLGTPATYENEQWFGKHYLKQTFVDEPVARFKNEFKPGPDSIITNTITTTRIVDKTPLFAFFVGPSFMQSHDGITNYIGASAGLKVKSVSMDLTYYENGDKSWSIKKYFPIKLRLF